MQLQYKLWFVCNALNKLNAKFCEINIKRKNLEIEQSDKLNLKIDFILLSKHCFNEIVYWKILFIKSKKM